MTTGYALRRNNTCHSASEIDCDANWGTMHLCCPFGTRCTDKNDCRTANTPPTQARCANSTWDIYVANDFFCCDQDHWGFKWSKGPREGYVGCATDGYDLERHQTRLEPFKEGKDPATSTQSTSLSTTTTSSPTTQTPGPVTSSPSESESSSSGTNAGAIAGGVVGGVAGVAIIGILIWLLMRRRARASQNTQDAIPPSEFYAKQSPVSDMSGNERPSELHGQPSKVPVQELSAN